MYIYLSIYKITLMSIDSFSNNHNKESLTPLFSLMAMALERGLFIIPIVRQALCIVETSRPLTLIFRYGKERWR